MTGQTATVQPSSPGLSITGRLREELLIHRYYHENGSTGRKQRLAQALLNDLLGQLLLPKQGSLVMLGMQRIVIDSGRIQNYAGPQEQ